MSEVRAADALIDIDDVVMLHAGVEHDVAALRGLTLRVEAGERVVVCGPSGSGKSTLISVVTGHAKPSAGRARLFGVDVGRLGDREARALRARIGIVSQRSAYDLLPEFTVAENVALQARLAGSSYREARRRAIDQLGEFALDHLADREPRTLSGGELQRVALAAALVDHPALVVADEPTGELDAGSAATVYEQLASYCAAHGAALLLVTHDYAAERLAQRVLTINDGRLSDERVGGHDTLVVDRRGWLRLPDAARRLAAVGDRVVAAADANGVVLRPPVPVACHEKADGPQRGQLAAVAQQDPVVVLDQATIDVGGRTRLGPLSVELCKGSLVTVSGPSGTGKTSLLSALMGRRPLESGHLHQRGVSRETVSCCPQAPGFAETASVVDNVQLGRALRHQPIAGAAASERDGMLARLGLLGMADRPVAMLSGGERQRVAVARALLTDSVLVVVDEPTSQLDRATANLVVEVLRAAARAGRCVVCATHDPDLIAAADRLIELDASVVVA
jgi:ABC-type lipoprotein export system ATPase subunit